MASILREQYSPNAVFAEQYVSYQVQELTGNSLFQMDLSASGSIGQIHSLVSAQVWQDSYSAKSFLVQENVLSANSLTQIVLSSYGGIGTSGSLLGNNAQQTNTSSVGFIIQASFLQGNVVKQLNLSSSGAVTQVGELPPLTEAELRSILAGMQLAIAELQVRFDSMF